MPNTFLTPDLIAMEALTQTEDQIVFGNSIYRGYAAEWAGKKVGDTITIRDYAELEATEYTGTINYQDVSEDGVSLKIEKHFHVPVKISSQQLTLELSDFGKQVVAPAIKGMNKSMEKYSLEQIKKVSRFAENVSGVPASGKDLAELEAQTVDMGFPSTDPKFYLMNARTKASLITADNGKYFDASVRADGGLAFRTANFGQILGINGIVSNLMPVKTVSTADAETGTSAAAVVKSKTDVAISLNGLTAGVNVEEGDIIVFTNSDDSVVYTSVKTGVTNATGTGDSVVVFYTDGAIESGATFEVKSIGYGCVYNSGAFALATIPLDQPMGGAEGAMINDPELGLGIRVVMNFVGLDNTIIFDTLAGADHIQHELAFRTDLV